jgi:L-seryl-tRNA(Ser) seleniumtransferase
MSTDSFGNPLVPGLGYAYGTLIGSSADEVRRLRNGQRLAAHRVMTRGADSVAIFTGNMRDFPLKPEDLPTLCEEWVGPGIFADDLRDIAAEHLGGDPSTAAAVFNRTSGGIVAAILALNEGCPIVSLVPAGDRSHASVVRGAALSGVSVSEVTDLEAYEKAIKSGTKLAVLTTVTSALARLEDEMTQKAVEIAHENDVVVLLDEAYGARLRPVLHGGLKSLALGGDIAITNADKAGLSGPRAGVMAGRGGLVTRCAAKAAELGIEARAPIAAGAMRSLQGFAPEVLLQEVKDGALISDALADLFGADVKRSDLGPQVAEDVVAAALMTRAGLEKTDFVPAEMTAALGMAMLEDFGVVTVNTHGQPGARISLRLKPTTGALATIGGPETLASALDKSMDRTAAALTDMSAMAQLIFGEG